MPFLATFPTISPVFESTESPCGKFFTIKLIGRSPVAAIVYRNGLLGLAPKSLGELILGFLSGGGVKIYFSSTLGVFLGIKSSFISNFASAQLE